MDSLWITAKHSLCNIWPGEFVDNSVQSFRQ